MKLGFSQQFFPPKTQISNFMKIRPVGAELFHADRHNETVAFRSFLNAPTNKCAQLSYPFTIVTELHRLYFFLIKYTES